MQTWSQIWQNQSVVVCRYITVLESNNMNESGVERMSMNTSLLRMAQEACSMLLGSLPLMVGSKVPQGHEALGFIECFHHIQSGIHQVHAV